MEKLKENKRIFYIPGWMDIGEIYGFKNNLDIWDNEINLDERIDADTVIAHSLGSVALLYNWNIYRNFRIILINPVFVKDNIFIRWSKYIIFEGVRSPVKRIKLMLFAVPAFYKAMKLFSIPVVDIINIVPHDKITIIMGEKDRYLCDKRIVNSLEKKGVDVVRVKNAGHNYNSNIEDEIMKIL
ncbi:MAG: hypothetical protein WCQ00_02685 [bacterium]